ncbi:MAG TPA: hypothetical protein VF669_19945 [Tepidisphaeraceae bacterium]|jgi:hypothetical protein
MPSEPSVHDNVVYAYTIDCEGRRLVLHTAFTEREPWEFTDVVFRDVVAHHFEHVLPGNILFDVEETDVAALVRENERLLSESWRWGWPPVPYDGDLNALVVGLNASGVRAYAVRSSYGLSGWVFAGSCQRVPRGEAAKVA